MGSIADHVVDIAGHRAKDFNACSESARDEGGNKTLRGEQNAEGEDASGPAKEP